MILSCFGVLHFYDQDGKHSDWHSKETLNLQMAEIVKVNSALTSEVLPHWLVVCLAQARLHLSLHWPGCVPENNAAAKQCHTDDVTTTEINGHNHQAQLHLQFGEFAPEWHCPNRDIPHRLLPSFE